MAATAESLFPARVDPTLFLDSMSRAVNGVSIVTTDGSHGRYGITVSTMTSVSASPPTLLVCINRSSVAHDAIRDNGCFGINILAAHQQQLANRFAGRADAGKAYTFEAATWYCDGPVPRLKGAAAWFDCRLVSSMTFGSHSIFVGEVVATASRNDPPLLYTGRQYGRPVYLN